ncbi:coiled-coil domain-containing protein 62 [Marmota marmota marmota]|uniref:coiled-coil domain-containing protein 62 n=1 Tax=Marmota marmota marmota TaxID=9994 RepID=UPI002093DAA7|nr:coiled-coil domain-containing protein 62 [Marmota marmota marmota]
MKFPPGELHKRTEIIKSLTKKVKVLESNQTECQTVLQKTQLQLQEMAQKATHSSLLSEDLEARNENLSNTLVELSAQVGQLQAREQALTTMIKLKDLTEKTTENNEQREEIIRLKQEKSCLHDELAFTVEREKRKDELLDIAKSKQERTNSELHNLRQIYVKQQSDLQFLNFNVENSQELIQIYDSKIEESKALTSSRDMCLSDLDNNHLKVDAKREKSQKSLVKDPKFETTLAQQNRPDKISCEVCKGKKLQINTESGEKNIIALSSLFTKDLMEKQKSWSLGGKIQSEPENKITLCKIHETSSKGGGIRFQNEEKQLWESSASLPDEKQWHDVSVYLGLTDCSDAKPPEKLDVDCHDLMEKSEMSCGPRNEGCQSDSDLYESKCCHPSNFIIEAPGHMSDMEWMSIFKPSKVQRIVRHKSVCTCSGSVSATKYNSSARLVMLTSICQHIVCVPERASSESCSSHLVPPVKPQQCLQRKEDFSPTSKLQRLLAESRQMVTDLELSTLLPISCENFDSSTRSNLEVSEESDQKNTFVSH